MTSHRQGYPFQGCVPTEPWSVSPCADIELYSRPNKQMTFRAHASKNPGGSGAKPLRDTAILSTIQASIHCGCSKSFLNKNQLKLNTVATQPYALLVLEVRSRSNTSTVSPSTSTISKHCILAISEKCRKTKGFSIRFDGSVEKVTVSGLLTEACLWHGSWTIRTLATDEL